MTDKTEKLFEFPATQKRVKTDSASHWYIRVPLDTFPCKDVSSGSTTFADEPALYTDLKDFGVTIPTEYYTCDHAVCDGYIEFTGKTETCVRLGLMKFVEKVLQKLFTRNLLY